MRDKKFYLSSILLIVTLIIVYANHFDNGFHFDDNHTIVSNDYIKDISNVPLFFKDAKTISNLPTNQSYRPVITTLNAFDYWLAGKLTPVPFHIHIFIEFILLCFLIFLFVKKIFFKASQKKLPYVALLTTAFFAFHITTPETINYIISRTDGFSTLMVLLGMLIFINNDGWKKQLGLIPFIIGTLAKPTTLMLAPILVVYQLLIESPSLFVKSEQKDGFLSKKIFSTINTLPYFLVGIFLYFWTKSMFSDTWMPSTVKPLYYLNTQPYIIWVYIKTFFLPVNLTADTDLGLIKKFFDARVIFGIFIILVSLGIAYVTAKKRRTVPIAFGILWFFIALFPSSSVIPLSEVMNHHRTFFPYIGLVISVSWAVYLIFDTLMQYLPSHIPLKKGFVVGILIFLGIHAYGSYQRNIVWDNSGSLWYEVTLNSPKNGRGLMNYGLHVMHQGDYELAMSYFKQARKTNYGNHPYLFINLGVVANKLGDKEAAESYFKTAVQKGHGYPECHYGYGKWLADEGRKDEAIESLSKAVALSPNHIYSKNLLAKLKRDPSEDLRLAEEEAANNPTIDNFTSLSLKYYNYDQFEKCISTCEKIIELDPKNAEAYNNMCSAYNKLKNWDKAIEACEKAIEIKPDFELAKNNLNWSKKKKGEL